MGKTANTEFYIGFIVFLISIFSLYNYNVYTHKSPNKQIALSSKAMEGQTLWQEKSCFSCHQLYGLGGYLGPDLTNTFSAKGKGSDYIKAFLNSGVKSMPKFNFSEKEKESLVYFLKEVDQTGYYPNHNAIIEPNGWVSIQYKNEK
jgi:nitric oxide reductase subunit C